MTDMKKDFRPFLYRVLNEFKSWHWLVMIDTPKYWNYLNQQVINMVLYVTYNMWFTVKVDYTGRSSMSSRLLIQRVKSWKDEVERVYLLISSTLLERKLNRSGSAAPHWGANCSDLRFAEKLRNLGKIWDTFSKIRSRQMLWG